MQDNTRYYVYAESIDLAGNTENPLQAEEYFSSNGLYDQAFILKYTPLIDWGYDFTVEIDDDFDGNFEVILTRGFDLSRLNQNEYFLDTSTKTLHFGGLSNGGYVPNEDLNSIKNIITIHMILGCLIRTLTPKNNAHKFKLLLK